MIIYDLKCKKNHQFEGWFKDGTAFEQQKEQGMIACPVCGETGAEMVPSTPTIMGRDQKAAEKKEAGVLHPLRAMQQLHAFIDKNFDDVGDDFAETAMKIHDGEAETRNIKGTTTPQDEEQLREKGVPFFKIPVIKFDS